MFFGIVASGSMLKTLRTMYNAIFRCAPWCVWSIDGMSKRRKKRTREWKEHIQTHKRMLHLQVQSSMHFFGLIVFRKVNDSHCSFVEVGFHLPVLSCLYVFTCVGFSKIHLFGCAWHLILCIDPFGLTLFTLFHLFFFKQNRIFSLNKDDNLFFSLARVSHSSSIS